MNSIETVIEDKFSVNFSEKLCEKFSAKFDELYHEIRELKSTNTHLIQNNKSLIAQNKELRSASVFTSDAVDDVVDDFAEPFFDNTQSYGLSGAHDTVDVDTAVDATPTAHARPKRIIDVLILSDSIFRHVGTECPKEQDVKFHNTTLPIVSNFSMGNLDIMKVIVPGAQCDRLLRIAAELHAKFSFEHVVVNVGTNYVRQLIPCPDVATDISGLLKSMDILFECKVTWSCILPQRNLGLIRGINVINYLVADFCAANGYGFLQCTRFLQLNGNLDMSLFARDGIHVSRKGAEALFTSFSHHLKFENIVEHC